jgi:hypothetical protein
MSSKTEATMIMPVHVQTRIGKYLDNKDNKYVFNESKTKVEQMKNLRSMHKQYSGKQMTRTDWYVYKSDALETILKCLEKKKPAKPRKMSAWNILVAKHHGDFEKVGREYEQMTEKQRHEMEQRYKNKASTKKKRSMKKK